MFGKLKDLNELRKQAGQMQSILAGEKIELEKNGLKIVMNGNMEILEISINPNAAKDELEQNLKELFNQAIKQIHKLMAEKMMGQL